MNISGSVSNLTQIPTRSHSDLQNLTVNDHPQYFTGYGAASARPAAGNAGRLYYATDTRQVSRDNGSTWDNLSPLEAFIQLSDAPASYSGAASKVVQVNAGATGLQFAAIGREEFNSNADETIGIPTGNVETLWKGGTVSAMGANDALLINWKCHPLGDPATVAIRLNGTDILTWTVNSSGIYSGQMWIQNKNATNAQDFNTINNMNSTFQLQTGTGAIDLSSAFVLDMTYKQNSGGTVNRTIEFLSVYKILG